MKLKFKSKYIKNIQGSINITIAINSVNEHKIQKPNIRRTYPTNFFFLLFEDSTAGDIFFTNLPVQSFGHIYP